MRTRTRNTILAAGWLAAFAPFLLWGTTAASASETLPANGKTGGELFDRHFPTGNGRSCATCHVASEAFSITPAGVEARFQSNPDDPLFRAIDADDFGQDFTTLRRHALIRVTLPLPENITVLNDPGRRSLALWRAVPPVWDVRFTAPYMHDGRHASLEGQAVAAINDHFEPARPPSAEFARAVADFQRALFSTPELAAVARALDEDRTPPDADPPLNPIEQMGKQVFQLHCATCHSGPALNDRLDIAAGLQEPGHDDDTTPIFRNFFNTEISSTNANRLPVHQLAITDPRTGLITVVTTPDPGLALITGQPADVDRFVIPPLRGISRSAPYFHDNSLHTLEDVISFYARPEVVRRTLAPPVPDDLRPALLAYLRRI